MRKAFSVVELLVVVAILAVLLSILAPSLGRAKELARRAVCASNLKNVGNALGEYAADNARKLPPAGAWWNNAMMLYVMYERAEGINPKGFNSLGLLEKESYIAVHSDLLFCPSETGQSWLANSRGDRDHGNCLPWNGNATFAPQGMLPQDEARFGWTNKRSAFIRRALGETNGTQQKGIDLIGARAFLADVFNSSGHVANRHRDGASVWYGAGNVRYVRKPDSLPWPDGSYVSGHETLRYMWEYFDDPEGY